MIPIAAHARDATGIARALQPVPDAQQVRRQLGSMFFGQIYDPEGQRDIWVGSDRDVLGVVILAGIWACRLQSLP